MDQLDQPRPTAYTFDSFELGVASLLLRYRDEPVGVGPKVVQTLLALIERNGEVASKAELLEAIWPEGYVEEANLSQNIYVLRKMLRARGAACRIETVPRRGYRLTAAVRSLAAEQPKRNWALRWPAAAVAAVVLMTVAAGSSHSQNASSPRLSAAGEQSYALGRYYWDLRSADALAKSLHYFNDVVKSDPASPLGYAGLADAYSMIEDYSCASMKCQHVVGQARANALKALRLDPNSAEARTSYAMVLELFDHRIAKSDGEFKRALELNPNYALAHEWYGTSLLMRGHMRAARAELEAALTLEPVATATNAWLGTEAYFDRRYADAIRYMRQALDLNNTHADSIAMLGLAQEQVHDYAGATATFARLARLAHHRADAQLLMAAVDARMGRKEQALAALRSARRSGHELEPQEIALVFIALGERDRALSYLRRTSRKELTWVVMDPRWDPVRGDARFRRWIKAG